MAAPSRRQLLAGLASALGAAAVRPPWRAARADDAPVRYLVNIAAFGGASMIDMFLALDASTDPRAPGGAPLVAHDLVRPAGRRLWCPDRPVPVRYLERYADVTAVLGFQASTLVHQLAEERIMNGGGALGGRTSTEAAAAVYGQGMALPNLNMGFFGFASGGTDETLDDAFRHEFIDDPTTFALATHGYAGVRPGPADPHLDDRMDAARATRDALELASPFGRTFVDAPTRKELLARRAGVERAMEQANLVEALMFRDDVPDFPLGAYGLRRADAADLVARHLPEAANTATPLGRLHGQAALTYLLMASGQTAASTMCTGVLGDLHSFDTHVKHLANQADK